MVGILVLIWFMASGIWQGMNLFYGKTAVKQIWLGSVIGLIEMMWFPSLFAYLFDFTMTAQLFAIALSTMLAVLSVICFVYRKRRADIKRIASNTKEMPLWLLVTLVAPMVVLAAYLQYTHNLRIVDGAYHVGQSTYGDLCMHVGFATGLIGQSYPPEYTILPGTKLGYPFLVNALSATMLLFNTPLSAAFFVPGTIMTVLIYMGFAIFAFEFTGKRSAAVLSYVLFVLNGGLGFLGTFNNVGADSSAFENALHGFYQTPTNMPEVNLRWVNALSDLIIPQRTLMAGWMCLMPCLYLLIDGIKSRSLRTFAILGVIAGALPMIHTHTFLGLGVISLGAMILSVALDKKRRRKTFGNFALYGFLACVIAFPQLLEWTFPQTVDGGSLRILFNWVNNRGDGSLIDGYFWFWIKNVGLVYLFFPIAAFSAKKRHVKAVALGACLLYLLSEFVLFQPNVYDNIKLFFVAFIVMLPAAADVIVDIYRRLKGVRFRWILAAAFIFCSVASGSVTIMRECISDYEIFSRAHVEAGEFIKENTPSDAVFLTSSNHNNAAAALAGRKIVCGSSLYVHFHGLDYGQKEADAALMMAYPEKYKELYDQYNVDYVFVSSYERSTTRIDWRYIENVEDRRNEYSIDEDKVAELYPLVYVGGEWYDTIRIYAVSERARALYEEIKQDR